jgi:hypothetical protein
MKRQGSAAAMIFCILSFGGIAALLSQVQLDGESSRPLRSMNVAAPEADIFKEVLPAAIRRGAALQAGEKAGEAPPKRLSLR